MPISLATSVTPTDPLRANNSITETARSTDWTEVLLRSTSCISEYSISHATHTLRLPGGRCKDGQAPKRLTARSPYASQRTSEPGSQLPEWLHVLRPREGVCACVVLVKRLLGALRPVGPAGRRGA